METVYSYTDYRRYLRDYFAEKKRLNPRYSYRVLAEKSGFKARDYLMRVMNGQRNLSSAGAAQLSEYFQFSEKQADYFETLVRFNQAETTLLKEPLYAKLSEIRKYGKQQRLRQDQFAYLSSWHHIALRSLLPILDKRTAVDPEKVGRLMDPVLSAKQVRDSIELLMRLGLLNKTAGSAAKTAYTVGEMALSTGDEVASLSVAEFHKTAMDLAKRSIDRHPSASRDISGLTMGVSLDGFRRIKNEIQAFRKKIMAIAVNDSGEDMLYQLNLHLFPLTRNQGRS
jgi:uncharacterized protein (TIGR02147 family)